MKKILLILLFLSFVSSAKAAYIPLGANDILGSLAGMPPAGQALSIPSCSTSGSALLWTSGAGFSCNTTIAASTVVTNANLTGPITSSGNITSVASQTGIGSTFVMNNGPTLIAPALGTPASGNMANVSGTATSLNIGGNAATVTNGIYNTDTGTVTNTMLAGSIANAKLTNSSVTVNGTSISLGASGTVTAAAGTLTGTTLAPSVTASSINSVGALSNGSLATGFTPVGLPQGGTNATSALSALVNLGVEDSANESHLVPHDISANRPGTPVVGMFRFNTTTLSPEMYANGAWEQFNAAPIGNNGILYNPSGNNLPHLRAALANVVNDTSNARILWIGTSTVSGYQSGGNGVWNQKFTEEYLMAQYLTNSYGIPANNDSIFGYPQAQGDQRVTDPRMTVGSGWASDSIWSIGGPMFANSSSTNNLSFTMPTTADKVILYYVTDSSIPLGTLTWQINSGSTTSINEGAFSAALASVTITLTPGSNTLNIARVSGTVKIVGYEAYLSTQATVDVINSGVGGVVAANFTGNGGGKPYGLPAVLATFAPNAILVQMDNNDAISGTATATYKSNITSILTGGSGTTDPLLIAQEPCGSAGGCSSSTLPPYITAQQQVAAASNLPFINQLARITSYDNVLTPLGYSNSSTGASDGLHASAAGYIDQGDFLTKEAMTILGLSPLPNQDVNPALADAAANRNYTGLNTFSGGVILSGSNTISGSTTFSNNNTHSGVETFTGPVGISTTAGCPAYSATINLTATSPYWEGVNTSTGVVTVNLPAVAQRLFFLIQDCSGNANTHTITISPNGSNTINGVNSSETITTSFGASALTGTSMTAWFAN